MNKTEKLTKEINELKAAIVAFVNACPDFEQGNHLAGEIGRKMANVETTLHWEFGCWELATPKMRE